MQPRPISEAPTDGTVILSDRGCVRAEEDEWAWDDGTPEIRWASCSPYGDRYKCADEGYFYCSPKFWVPLPDWMR